MNILPILQSENNIPGPFMEIGFDDKGISKDVLSYIKDKKISPINFVLFNKYNKNNRRYGIDFQTIGTNYHSINTKVVDSSKGNTLSQTVLTHKPSIVFFNPSDRYTVESTLKQVLSNSIEGTIVIIGTEDSKNIKAVSKFCKSNLLKFSLGDDADFSYITKGITVRDKGNNKDPLPLAKPINSKVTREHSPNLT